MKNLLIKEIRLAASPLTFIFIAFVLMAFLPGYPILVGSFFVCLGIFYSFQSSRENNDILYTALLPVKKSDVVKAKYVFTCVVQIAAFVVTSAVTAVRMTALADAETYVNNVMMNANFIYLAFVLIIFAEFNLFFLGGFFRTAYKFGPPFIVFCIVSFVTVAAGETLHHIPALETLNLPVVSVVHVAAFVVAMIAYAAITLLSYEGAKRNFERIDL